MLKRADIGERRQEFAGLLRALGTGPDRSRSLSREEAARAMELILASEVEPVQVGAFLSLMQHRGASAKELAGLAGALRGTIAQAPALPRADLDWPSYVERRHRLPWFVLSALLVARSGLRVLMHGTAGEEGFVPTRAVLRRLGVPLSGTPEEAARALSRSSFAYLKLEGFCPALGPLLALRRLLGLRSPLHGAALHLNPLAAPFQMIGVFHERLAPLHRDAALLLEQPKAAAFHGTGGEAQRNAARPCRVTLARDGAGGEETWPALPAAAGFRPGDEALDEARIPAVWRGERSAGDGPRLTVTGTAALALKLADRADSMEEAQCMAERLWRERAPFSTGKAAEPDA